MVTTQAVNLQERIMRDHTKLLAFDLAITKVQFLAENNSRHELALV